MQNDKIHFIKKIILINIILPFIVFLYMNIFLNIYNPYLNFPLKERILIATIKNIFIIIFIILDIPAALFIGYFLKPVKDAFNNPSLFEKAKKRITSFPLIILTIYLAAYLSAPILVYTMPSNVQLNRFIIVFMVTFFIGIFAFSFVLFYSDFIMFKVKKLFGIKIIQEKDKELSLNIKYIICSLSMAILVLSISLCIGYFYYIKGKEADTGDFVLNIIINGFIIILIGIIQLFILNKNVENTIKNIKIAIESITEGNCDLKKRVDIASFDELGLLTSDVNKLLDFLNKLIDKIYNVTINIKESNKFLVNSIENNKNVFDSFIESINKIIEGISGYLDNLDKTKVITEKLNISNETIRETTTNQYNSINEAYSSIKDMTLNIYKVVDITKKSDDDFKKILLIIEEGKNSLNDAINKIKLIKSSSDEFLNFINNISEISERINVLAINASIEAVHAGKKGEGFKVVASEVRKLSERSGNIVKNIENMLKEMNNKIIEGTEKITNVSKIIENFFDKTKESIILLNEITESMIRQENETRLFEKSSQEVLNNNQILINLVKNGEEIVKEMNKIFDYFYSSSKIIYLLSQDQKEKNEKFIQINRNLFNSSELLKNSYEKLEDILKEFYKN
jgi:methyl-accepting chemotaxis protein